jgi:hypothetical protein
MERLKFEATKQNARACPLVGMTHNSVEHVANHGEHADLATVLRCVVNSTGKTALIVVDATASGHNAATRLSLRTTRQPKDAAT